MLEIRPLGDDFIVNSTITNNQDQPAVSQLSDGRVFVVWRSADVGSIAEAWIRGRFFGTDGKPAGDDFLLPSDLEGYNSTPTVTALPDGRIFAAWTKRDLSQDRDIVGRFFNQDGSPADDQFVVNTTTESTQSLPIVTALPDSRVFVVWQTSEDGLNYSLRGQFVSAEEGPNGVDFPISLPPGDFSDAAVAALPDGRLLVTCRIFDVNDGSAGDIHGQFLNADGSPVGDDFVINSKRVSAQVHPSIAVLPDGRVFMAWESLERTTAHSDYYDIRGRILNPDGTFAGRDFLINSTVRDGQFEPKVTALLDGHVFVVWSDFKEVSDASGHRTTSINVRGQFLDATGNAVGSDFPINTSTVPTGSANEANAMHPTVTALPDGRVFVAWECATDLIGDGSGHCIRGRYFVEANTIAGSAAAEVLDGTTYFDVISGDGGKDTIFGLDGNDTLHGGLGSDRVEGGIGNDNIKCGVGNDLITGGAGKDTLTAGKGNDRFIYTHISQSGTGFDQRDVVTDFVVDFSTDSFVDRIDVSTIDAIAGTAHNDTFSYIGEAAFTDRGQIRAFQSEPQQ